MSQSVDLVLERTRMSSRKWRAKFHSNSPYRWDGMFPPALSYPPRSRLLASICRPVSQVAGEIRGTLERAKYMLSIAESSLADVGLQDTDKPGLRRFIRRTPLGVVLVIAPWKCVILFMSHSCWITLCCQLPLSYFDQLDIASDHCRQLGVIEAVAPNPTHCRAFVSWLCIVPDFRTTSFRSCTYRLLSLLSSSSIPSWTSYHLREVSLEVTR
jgi:hypothetical protein